MAQNNPSRIDSIKKKAKDVTGTLSKGASEKRESLINHLGELRRRLVMCIVTFVIAMLVCLFFSEPLVKNLMGLGDKFTFVYISPTELMLSYLRIALVGGIVFAFPMLGYQLWRFMCPGLTAKEKQACFGILTLGVLLFVCGAVFCYMIVLPIALTFLAGINTDGTISAMVSIESYMTFVITMLVTFGVVFELPIVTILLTQIGILNPRFMRRNRKYVILIIFILAAIITPPDVTTQVLVAFPMMALFEISIMICSVLFRKKLEAQEAAEAEDDNSDE